MAKSAHKPLDGDARARWIAVLGDDLENLRAAMDHLLASGDVERGFNLIGSIWRFFQSSGRLAELDLWLGRFFAADTAEEPTRARARALIARAGKHYWRAEYRATAADYEAAIAIAEALDDKPLQAEAWAGLTSTRGAGLATGENLGDPFEAIDRAGQLAVGMDDPALIAAVRFGRIAMNTLFADRQTIPAIGDLEELLRLYEQAGQLMNIAHTQVMLSELYIAHSEFAAARSSVLEGLTTAEKAGDTFTMAWALHRYAIAAIELGDVEVGARIAGASAEARARAGGTFPPPFFPIGQPEDRAIAALGEAAAQAAFAEGRELSLFEAVALARESAATD
jgi:tetratricopeptide (TPR) repeat protein